MTPMKQDAAVFWVNTRESEVHFIDAILSAYDGMANVRRDYRVRNGKMYFKVYISPGMKDEFLFLTKRLRQSGTIIGDVLEEQANEDSKAA